MAGRPSTYTQETADLICERLAGGESLNAICKDEGLPAESTVRLWALDDREGFAAKYARARELQAERWAEEILSIADDSSQDTVIRYNEKGNEYEATDHDHINRSRLRVDSRKWLLSKLIPKKYGESTLLKHADPEGNSLNVNVNVTRIEGKSDGS
jgi:hypothetical protein